MLLPEQRGGYAEENKRATDGIEFRGNRKKIFLSGNYIFPILQFSGWIH